MPYKIYEVRARDSLLNEKAETISKIPDPLSHRNIINPTTMQTKLKISRFVKWEDVSKRERY